MSREFAEALIHAVERLVSVATADPDVRRALRRLFDVGAKELDLIEADELTRAIAEAPPPAPAKTRARVAPAAPSSPEPLVEAPPAMAAPPVAIASALASPVLEPPIPEAPPVAVPAFEPIDLNLIVRRCRLKAEGLRWAAARHRLMLDGADCNVEIFPYDAEIITRAKAIQNCYLWMCDPRSSVPGDFDDSERAALTFEAAAEALRLVIDTGGNSDSYPELFERAIELLAEAQSALRVAVQGIDGPEDTDQKEIFIWLREIATERRIYIERYMRLNDPADPDRVGDLQTRIEEVEVELLARRDQDKKRRRWLSKIRHKTSQIAKDPGANVHEWPLLVRAIDELVADGLPSSNRELRDLILPVIDEIPDDLQAPKNFALVLRHIDEFLALAPPPKVVSTPVRTADVERVAQLLGGRSIVLIGGDARPGAAQALTDALAVKALQWVSSREHQSIASFEYAVADADVAVVLIAIRWSSHSFEGVKEMCAKHGKLFVRLPGGYNPNQVALQIMRQVGNRLGER